MWILGIDRAMDILGADSSDSWECIKHKYRELVQQYHPDNTRELTEDALEKIKNITSAYNFLKSIPDLSQNISRPKKKAKNKVNKKQENKVNRNKKKKETSKREQNKGKVIIDNSLYNLNAYRMRTRRTKVSEEWNIGYINKSEEGFWGWNPDLEDYDSFRASLDSVRRDLITEIKEKYYSIKGVSPYEMRVVDLATQDLCGQLLFYLMEEYIRPYNCLWKIVNKERQKCENDNTLLGGAVLQSVDNCDQFSDIFFEIDLVGTTHENRTENIEKYAQRKDELVVCCQGDNPRFLEKIEIFTQTGYSLGTLPARLAMCIAPLVLSGQVEITAEVKEVRTRAMRGKQAKKAEITINLYMRLLRVIESEPYCSFRPKIEKLLDEYVQRIDRIITLCRQFDTRELFYSLFTSLTEQDYWIEKRFNTMSLKGTYYNKDGSDKGVFFSQLDGYDYFSLKEGENLLFLIIMIVADTCFIPELSEGKYYARDDEQFYVMDIKRDRFKICRIGIKGYIA